MPTKPSSRPRKGRRPSHEAEGHAENSERWLLTYADMITLLMVLFIVLFAISGVDESKYDQFQEGLSAGFGAPLAAVSGGTGALEHEGVSPRQLTTFKGVVPPPQPGTSPYPPELGKALEEAEARKQQQARERAATEAGRLKKLQKQVEEALKAKGLGGAARFRLDERGLVVSIITDAVLFPADSAKLEREGQKVLAAIAPVLQDADNRLMVEGHTNTVPVKPKNFTSEWHLSSARAATVVRYLEGRGIPSDRMGVGGYGDTRPLPIRPGERADELNRRVEVVVLSNLDEAARGLLPGQSGD